jgi:bacterial/archaeal transporter family-2 protein
MNWLNLGYIAGALGAGMLIPAQTGFNAQLGRALGGPFYSTICVFLAGLATMTVIAIVVRAPAPGLAEAARAPTLSWFAGGVMGALYIVSLTVLAPRLGAAPTVAFVVVGQMLCSTIIDHYGLLGFAEHAASPLRIAGLALMAVGVALVRMY